jgi:predicted Na+-dependent transporter
MLERFLLLLLSLLAYCWDAWLPGYWNPFISTTPGLKYLFAVTMLAIGSLLPHDEVRQVMRRWPMVLAGTALQYTSMPLLALNVGGYLAGAVGGRLLRLSSPMRRALILEIGMQNAGLGATLAVELFGKNCAEAIAPAVYAFGCMLTGTVLVRLWAEFGGPKEHPG